MVKLIKYGVLVGILISIGIVKATLTPSAFGYDWNVPLNVNNDDKVGDRLYKITPTIRLPNIKKYAALVDSEFKPVLVMGQTATTPNQCQRFLSSSVTDIEQLHPSRTLIHTALNRYIAKVGNNDVGIMVSCEPAYEDGAPVIVFVYRLIDLNKTEGLSLYIKIVSNIEYI